MSNLRKNNQDSPTFRHYFVDEAGDAALFGKRGRILPGNEGCSRFFMMGCLDLANPSALSADIERLRQDLLSDPTLNRGPKQGKRRISFMQKMIFRKCAAKYSNCS